MGERGLLGRSEMECLGISCGEKRDVLVRRLEMPEVVSSAPVESCRFGRAPAGLASRCNGRIHCILD